MTESVQKSSHLLNEMQSYMFKLRIEPLSFDLKFTAALPGRALRLLNNILSTRRSYLLDQEGSGEGRGLVAF